MTEHTTEHGLPVCQACYAKTLSPDERERFKAESVTMPTHLCREHQDALDAMLPPVTFIKAPMPDRRDFPRDSAESDAGGHPTRVTTVGTRCSACGSTDVRATYASGMVIRECASCEKRIGSYHVKTRPRWAQPSPIPPGRSATP